jgi:hypothetical protein
MTRMTRMEECGIHIRGIRVIRGRTFFVPASETSRFSLLIFGSFF